MKVLTDCRLYGFVDTAYLHGRPPEIVAAQLCEGGVDILQLRAKGLPSDAVQRIAEKILPLTRRAGVPLVINDHLEVARAIGAELCHLGQEDFFGAGFTVVSQLSVGEHQPGIGLSTHAPDQARRAIAAGPAYIAIGPVFATRTKPGVTPVTLEYVRWAASNVSIPWFAIGGITLDNLDEVLAAGARRICVVSAMLEAADVVRAAQAFARRLGLDGDA